LIAHHSKSAVIRPADILVGLFFCLHKSPKFLLFIFKPDRQIRRSLCPPEKIKVLPVALPLIERGDCAVHPIRAFKIYRGFLNRATRFGTALLRHIRGSVPFLSFGGGKVLRQRINLDLAKLEIGIERHWKFPLLGISPSDRAHAEQKRDRAGKSHYHIKRAARDPVNAERTSGSRTRASRLCAQRVSKPAALGNPTGPQLAVHQLPVQRTLQRIKTPLDAQTEKSVFPFSR